MNEHSVMALDGIAFGYGERSVFEDLSWSVACGELWAVIGPSGSGKTSLLLLLAGLLRPREGGIFLHGTRVVQPDRNVGLVLQDHGLLPWATVWDNIALGMKIRGIGEKKRRNAIEEWLRQLGLVEVQNNYPSQLSGGQRQRVALARTLVLSPDIVLMDEPFSALDALTRESLQDLLLTINQDSRRTTIIVTHDITEAAFLANRIAVLKTSPTREFAIVENPGAGRQGYRHTHAFQEVCTQLRQFLAQRESLHSHITEDIHPVQKLFGSTA